MQIGSTLRPLGAFWGRPLQILRDYRLSDLQPDLAAGLTVAVITIPQAMSYALIAELPPQYGLYAAIVGSIIGALWGSCRQLQTGPTNAASLLVLSVLMAIAAPGSAAYLAAAGLMAVLVGLLRTAMGMARLGALVRFVSDSVIVGFSAGAGILIVVNQLRHILRLNVSSAPNLIETLVQVAQHSSEIHWPSVVFTLGTIILIVGLRRVNPNIPGLLIAMVLGSLLMWAFGLDRTMGLNVVGALPRGLPPVASLPLLDLDLIGKLSVGSLAVAAIGLVEAMSIARGIAAHTGQPLNANQEFVGQGLANVACGFVSGYPCSGSFTRSAVNHQAGARTGMSSVFGGLIVLAAMLAFAPLGAYIPLTSLAGVLAVTAWGLVDRQEIGRAWRGAPGDRTIMAVTFAASLLLPLQFAVLAGILMSLGSYLLKTSAPRVVPVVPNGSFSHFVPRGDKPSCPQLGIVEIQGDLYFGAAQHIADEVLAQRRATPDQRFILLRMHSVEECDLGGVHALEAVLRAYREQRGDVFAVRVTPSVLDFWRATGLYDRLGADHLLTDDGAIARLFYHVLDPALCIYECPVRLFQECQNLPRPLDEASAHVRLESPAAAACISPRDLWGELKRAAPPLVIDVREPREYAQGHIPGARLVPLPALIANPAQIPTTPPVVLVCRGGRRSARAAALLAAHGHKQVRALEGGMLAWEAANLLEAFDDEHAPGA